MSGRSHLFGFLNSPDCGSRASWSYTREGDNTRTKKRFAGHHLARKSLARHTSMYEESKKLRDLYRLEDRLGQGNYGEVYRATQLSSGKIFAAKSIIKKPSWNVSEFKRRIAQVAPLPISLIRPWPLQPTISLPVPHVTTRPTHTLAAPLVHLHGSQDQTLWQRPNVLTLSPWSPLDSISQTILCCFN